MKFFLILLSLSLGTSAFASQGLVIHSAEFGVGKFHRYDNKVHPYDHASAWSPYILPDQASSDQPLVQKNSDGSFTVFFSTLEELVHSIVQLSQSEHQKISVLNVHGHGLPGAMWFPKDAAALSDWQCGDWKSAADGQDQDNYEQYYSAVSVGEIQQIRQMAENPNIQMGCTTGLKQWTEAAQKTPQLKSVFADDAQLHFLSCVVGLGTAGARFTQGMAELLLPRGSGHVETSVDFGLGDWSMNEGMGFWDLQSEAQVDHDNSVYVVNRKDLEIAQKGTIRLASYSGSRWDTALLSNRDFMSLSFEKVISGTTVAEERGPQFFDFWPARIRIPGTQAYAAVLRH